MTSRKSTFLPLAALLAIGGGVALAPASATAQMYDRGADAEFQRLAREQFERGYRLGLMNERQRIAQGAQRMAQGGMAGGGEATGADRDAYIVYDPRGFAYLLVERGRQEQAADQADAFITEAQQALRQGDRQAAEEALLRADRALQQASASMQVREQMARAEQRLSEAEQALQRNDTQAARQAVRQVRQMLQQQQAASSGMQQSQTGGQSRMGSQTGGQTGTGADQPPQASGQQATGGGSQQGGSASGQSQ